MMSAHLIQSIFMFPNTADPMNLFLAQVRKQTYSGRCLLGYVRLVCDYGFAELDLRGIQDFQTNAFIYRLPSLHQSFRHVPVASALISPPF